MRNIKHKSLYKALVNPMLKSRHFLTWKTEVILKKWISHKVISKHLLCRCFSWIFEASSPSIYQFDDSFGEVQKKVYFSLFICDLNITNTFCVLQLNYKWKKIIPNIRKGQMYSLLMDKVKYLTSECL